MSNFTMTGDIVAWVSGILRTYKYLGYCLCGIGDKSIGKLSSERKLIQMALELSCTALAVLGIYRVLLYYSI